MFKYRYTGMCVLSGTKRVNGSFVLVFRAESDEAAAEYARSYYERLEVRKPYLDRIDVEEVTTRIQL